MKKILLFSALLLLQYHIALSQQAAAGAVKQKIAIKQFRGKQVTLQATARVYQVEKEAAAILFLKVIRENGQAGAVFYSTPPIYKNSWNTYTVSGQLDADADSLSLGALCSGKAVYYLDRFILRVNDEVIPLSGGGFENITELQQSSWSVPLMPAGFAVKVAATGSFEGTSCLVIDGSGGAARDVPGENEAAGAVAAINGVNIYYEIYGNGEPLLLLHGNQQAIGVFKEQIREFSKYYKVIAVDARGQGRSTYDDTRYTYDLFADDMNQLLTQLRLDSVNIAGWSDGGNTALIMAMKYPARVKRVVTMGACVFIDNTVVDKKVFSQVNRIIEKLQADNNSANANTIRLYSLLLTEPKHRFDELKSITCPVLVMAGAKDIIKPGHTKGIAGSIPHATLLIAAKETHYYPVENPASFNETVLSFLRKN